MNNLVISSDSLFLRVHKVYYVVLDYQVTPAEYEWSWKLFKRVQLSPCKDIAKLQIKYSIFNEVTQKLENSDFTISYNNVKNGEQNFKKLCEQLMNQDPTLRYVDDALEKALKGTND